MITIIDKNISAYDQADMGIWNNFGAADAVINPVTGNIALDFQSSTKFTIYNNGQGNTSDIFSDNLFHEWNMEVHFYNVTGEAYIGQQSKDPTDIRSVFGKVNQSTGKLTIWLQDNYFPPLARINLPTTFNYNNFVIRLDYDNMYVTLSAIEYNGLIPYRTTTTKWRSNLFITNSLSTGNFSFGVDGTAVVESVGVTTKLDYYMDYIFIGDSITAGRGRNPTQVRFADKVMNKFHNDGVHNLRYAVMASAGYTLDKLLTSKNALLNIHPKNVIILVGANDPQRINKSDENPNGDFNQPWMDTYKQFILDMQDADINVIVLTMTPDNGDPKTEFRDAMWNNWPTDPDINHFKFKMIDTLTPLIIGGGNYNWNPLYSNGGPHPSAAGDVAIANIIYPNLI